jgi:enediyne polyketide synthase
MPSVAIVALACRYPEAPAPPALWHNVLTGRRSFRRIPAGRLDLAAYAAERIGAVDAITQVKAGLISGWDFDLSRFRIPRATFEAADLTHWLALDVASEAIAAAGGIAKLGRERTMVVVANTLGGEFSRAAMIRLRGPFLDGVIAEAIQGCEIDDAQAIALRRRFASLLRERLPDPQEETLAGALANTIAGRVANYFDLHGGAYVVDAACASSLLAVADAAEHVSAGRADAAIVGAVDLSLDPFELVGFSRNGALATDDMRVFDARSAGFWPGEGAGFAVLMRHDDALRQQLPVLAVLRGWGISTDGAGGFTRPAVSGQLTALRRAYDRAGIDPADVGYVEAHGTGTAVGDPVEVRALATMRGNARAPLPIGSIKANIGHTKAAAGLAGLIKAVCAVRDGVIPPHVSCDVPHPVFREVDGSVYPAPDARPWLGSLPRIAGISGFGFGGINAHLVLEAAPSGLSTCTWSAPSYRPQDAELFVFAADTAEQLCAGAALLAARTESMSVGEFVDAAAQCAAEVVRAPLRAAIVAKDPDTLRRRLDTLIAAATASRTLDGHGVFVARREAGPRIGLLFPGQAAPSRPDGGLWARRFTDARRILGGIPASAGLDPVDTAMAQPAIAAASLAAYRLLHACGITADIAAGHSLGELTALAWAEAIDEDDLLPVAAARGAVMSEHGLAGGGMLRVAAGAPAVRSLIQGLPLQIACLNGSTETVVSGPRSALLQVERRARERGVETTLLAVSHAFHSVMMDAAVAPLAAVLTDREFSVPQRHVISTVAGRLLGSADDLRQLLLDQLTNPVEFTAALAGLAQKTDLLVEAGSGHGLSRLARGEGLRAISVDAFATSLEPFLTVLAVLFAEGAPVRFAPLFADRSTRPIELGQPPRLLTNPCGSSEPRIAESLGCPAIAPLEEPTAEEWAATSGGGNENVLSIVRALIAEETGFDPSGIREEDHLLGDLHLNSLTVARIVAKAARRIDNSPPLAPTEFANATVRELADGLATLRSVGGMAHSERIAGIAPWVRCFAQRLIERSGPRSPRSVNWRTIVLGDVPGGETTVEPADGILIWLADGFSDAAAEKLLVLCRAAWGDGNIRHLAICHRGGPVAAFARSIALEERFTSVSVIERAARASTVTTILSVLQCAPDGYSDLRVQDDGRVLEPRLTVVEPIGRPAALSSDDVILVTGGAKGIGAECALRLAERSGAALLLVGRSGGDDPEVSAALARARALGLKCHYGQADVTDPDALARAVAEGRRALGPITMLLHAAGINEPMSFPTITEATLSRMLAPKVCGLRAAVAAAGASLRRIVTFGSIIGRLGLQGEAHYALANEWQSAVGEELARSRPDCAVLSLEWSIWNAAGMGQRLGSIDRLARLGVDAIELDAGLDVFESLVLGGVTGTLVVTSRFGLSPGGEGHALPMLRFVGQPLVHYPDVELVVETELSAERDLYLSDHRLDGVAVMPAVLGLEAMAQVAMTLTGCGSPGGFEGVSMDRAIFLPENESVAIRIMGLVVSRGRVEVAISAGDDAFSSTRMRATLLFEPQPSASVRPDRCHEAISVDAAPLYGPLLFQEGRYRRIASYSRITARRVSASLSGFTERPWFSEFEPQQLVLGDPGARDALLHCLQVSVPHRRVLPVSVERIALHSAQAPSLVEARERSAGDDWFVFDISAWDEAGELTEEWIGATFRAVGHLDVGTVVGSLPALAGAYLERVARSALAEPSIEVSFIADSVADRPNRRSRALDNLGLDGHVHRRGDGKPLVIGSGRRAGVSIAHREGMTLAVAADRTIVCDIERVADWIGSRREDVLSPHAKALVSKLSDMRGEARPVAAARVWALSEATLKQGQHPDQLCRMAPSEAGNVVVMDAPSGRIVTIHVPGSEPYVAAVGLAFAARKQPVLLKAVPGP